jgi:hypothetical protein
MEILKEVVPSSVVSFNKSNNNANWKNPLWKGEKKKEYELNHMHFQVILLLIKFS